MKNRYAIGVDVGGSHISCAVVDIVGAAIIEETVVECDVNNRAEAHEILDTWSGAIRHCAALAESTLGVKPAAVGLAIPGPFDYRRGVSTIAGVDKFESIFGLDVASSLGARLRSVGVERLAFINDATAYALGECRGGAGYGSHSVVVLTLGTGFGSGFVSGGRIVEAGDTVPFGGWVYCLPFEETIADDVFSTRWFCRRYREITGSEVKGAKDIADMGPESTIARTIFTEFGSRLGEFIFPVEQRFRADAIVVGGNIARAYDLFAPALTATLKRLGSMVEVRQTKLWERAAIMGATSFFD